MRILQHLEQFVSAVSQGKIEIYNEASVQFELAIYLRKQLGDKYKVQLERNIKYFNLNGEDYEKKEMDIVIFAPDKTERSCVELKFPIQGQFPEQMFKACTDIKFLEQLTTKAGFISCYFMMFANQRPFWCGRSEEPIYRKFRVNKIIEGVVTKPTGKERDKTLRFEGTYKIDWQDILPKEKLKYFIVEMLRP